MSFVIPHDRPSKAFAECWHVACSHINGSLKSVDRPWPPGPFFSWYKSNLKPPFLEHFSFRLGNQLFFVRVEDVGGPVTGPGSSDGLLRIADQCRGYACVMPMRHRWGKWRPEASGWGLTDARTNEIIDPPTLVTNEPIEMTDWEVHDIAVDFVCHNLRNEGIEIISSQGDPEIYPSIWISRSIGPEWIMVRAVRFPHDNSSVPMPSNWVTVGHSSAQIAMRVAPELAGENGTRGYFAAVGVARSDQKFDDRPNPLLRGHEMISTIFDLSTCPSDVFALTGVKH